MSDANPVSVTDKPIADSDELFKDVLDYARASILSGKDFRVTDIKDPFLNGKLYQVAFTDDQKNPYFVRVHANKNGMTLYRHDDILLAQVGLQYRERAFAWFSTDYMAAYMALLITIMIGYVIVWHGVDVKIPDILTNALTVILGFYFGRSTTR